MADGILDIGFASALFVSDIPYPISDLPELGSAMEIRVPGFGVSPNSVT
jgi:hypothetical protein